MHQVLSENIAHAYSLVTSILSGRNSPFAGGEGGAYALSKEEPRVESGTGVESGAGVESGVGAESGAWVESGSGVESGTGVESGAGVENGTGVESGTWVESGARVESGTENIIFDILALYAVRKYVTYIVFSVLCLCLCLKASKLT